MRSAEFQPARDTYQEFLDSEYYDPDLDYLSLLRNLGNFVRSKNINPVAGKQLFRRMANLIRTEMPRESQRR